MTRQVDVKATEVAALNPQLCVIGKVVTELCNLAQRGCAEAR